MSSSSTPLDGEAIGDVLAIPQPIELLRELVGADIARNGPMSSTMVRAGLLADILDELEALRAAATAARKSS